MIRYTPVTLEEFETLLRVEKGWTKNTVSNEIVFDKKLSDATTIRVYTTIPANNSETCRGKGVDAVRYCSFNETKRWQSRKSKKILRTANWQDRLKTGVTALVFELIPLAAARASSKS